MKPRALLDADTLKPGTDSHYCSIVRAKLMYFYFNKVNVDYIMIH